MALYMGDESVDDLARKVQQVLKLRTKTEAVKIALQHELERSFDTLPVIERIKRAQMLADSMGASNKDFDMKSYCDEMWGNI